MPAVRSPGLKVRTPAFKPEVLGSSPMGIIEAP